MEIKDIYSNFPVLETDRLILRKFTMQDINDLYEYASDEETTKYVRFYPYQSIEDAKKYLYYLFKKYDNGEVSPWAVVLKENNKVIGSVDFIYWDIINSNAEIGYIYNKNYWGKGIGTEAAKRLMEFGFNQMRLHRICADCVAENIASEIIMKKLGMRCEGISLQSDYKYEKYRDIKHYAILKSEYEANKAIDKKEE